ncbi:YecR family lipoprotein [Lonsdalea quercina]|uniref:YecR family lipoprotein n=1 Tax=Lonsdalea quercina TaxID=71657 RepID=UPI0039768CE8
MKKLIVVVVGTALLAGCSATPKDMVPMGGSKADGTVRMGYTVGMFENAKIDPLQAQNLAAKKCKTWGYSGAEAFGGQTSNCGRNGAYGCELMNVSVEYQCTGGAASQN